MTRKKKSLLLFIPFVVIYFIARSLPVEPCEFLHEETYNEEGVLDYCGPGDSGFVDLTTRKWPLKMDLRALGGLEPNKACEFEINLKEFDGSPLAADEVALSHTQKIHLLAIDSTLQDYQHLHPEPDSLFDGIWRFKITPKYSGEYKIFLDLIPIRSPRRILLSGSFSVDGPDPGVQDKTHSTQVSVGSRKFAVEIEPNEFSDEVILTFKARDELGSPLLLRPVMGAHAHMVAFDWERKGFAHLHPLETEDLTGPAVRPSSNDLQFSFNSSEIEQCRLWVQVLLEEDEFETFIPFNLDFRELPHETN